MNWEVKRPPAFTDAMEATLERLGVERVTGWAKRENGVYRFNVSGETSHLGREITVGPRGGIHSDTQVDYDRKRAACERRKEREETGGVRPVYSRDGTLIGLRLW